MMPVLILTETAMSDPKDAFDLLDYPCEFQFKAMVRISGLADGETAEQVMRAHLAAQVVDTEVMQVTTASSRTGRFESVSITMMVADRDQLEQIYTVLASHEHVVMTL